MRFIVLMSSIFLACAATVVASIADSGSSLDNLGWIAFAVLLLGACTGLLFDCAAALPTLILAAPALIEGALRDWLQRNKG